ncbi:5' nucleotidase, NT5C type [Macrococcus armenti]|uniref:5' nucleotidase, NT5C type n=1 Tax=Macrococcus armenti TaxID=2875764 RepID=UPI001CCF8F43|nr:hypothetical protein [Macrococcus armenti]UBH07707.1 hypothetical protein LAU41_06620 [Macrococcus armenti]UBH09942.1 hypothetical protein LAU38_06525 [Macrococcus armenti]UBH14491.1 hypothetical protein LAU44_06805 [Macrococcus armenti]UBH16851.1 hypothetical protein LAU39_06825 [Macrococcus armenti]UBH19114.1 hypothetical protein LAU40_06810 [Macrococcus armenti]
MQKSKIRFGIDIDGTVTCPTALVPYLQKSFNPDFKYEDITAYELTTVLGISNDEVAQWFKENERELYIHSPVHKDADKILRQWSDQFELYFISARHTLLTDITFDWFNRHNIPYHHIELTGSHNKIEIARELQVDAFFEDKLDNAIDIQNALNIPVYLFDTPYNQSHLPKDVYRVYSWIETNNIIQKHFNDK